MLHSSGRKIAGLMCIMLSDGEPYTYRFALFTCCWFPCDDRRVLCDSPTTHKVCRKDTAKADPVYFLHILLQFFVRFVDMSPLRCIRPRKETTFIGFICLIVCVYIFNAQYRLITWLVPNSMSNPNKWRLTIIIIQLLTSPLWTHHSKHSIKPVFLLSSRMKELGLGGQTFFPVSCSFLDTTYLCFNRYTKQTRQRARYFY